ncbi:inositol monophosphatase family protein [Litorisediminicola beolgyonensis]|uniref:Inositol monophosphatase family protein n=1 Tax=Litorisediminicola beolgyonensis TaxID=1173614 RepID=A0ABW3ZFL8_9RHOB
MSETLPAAVTAPLSRAQKAEILNLVRRAARAEILPRFRRLAPGEIDQKSGPQDLVTEADRAAEAMIARALQRRFPHALIVGEENVASNPGLVAKLAEAETGFTIDPVDGTWNFANGIAAFGVIISMTRYGIPVWGMLYDPLLDDVIEAEAGAPAEYRRGRAPARRLKVSGGGAIEDLGGFASLHLLPEAKRIAMATTFPRFQRLTSLRCACHEFRTFAQGGVDFVLAAGLTPWDHSAGAVIGARAGGVVRLLDGSDYRADRREGYLLAAADEATWNRLRDLWAFLLED